MSPIDLRAAVNAISDVVVNRPPPLREFDQIYMKVADMLLQAEHLSKWLDRKSTVFVGDGDAIGLALLHLRAQGVLSQGPKAVHILDFDERVVSSVTSFAHRFQLEGVTAQLYNVADPLPRDLWQRFDAFYTNPPYGASNHGKSVESFVLRGIEASAGSAIACLVVADYSQLAWPRAVLYNTQRFLLDKGFVIVEMVPEFHHYHLDDTPDLTSCSLVARRAQPIEHQPYDSHALGSSALLQFYGEEAPLKIRYVRDLRQGGKVPSRDYSMEPFHAEEHRNA